MQPRTPKQTANRSLLAAGASAWRGLSDAQRTAWNDYAAQITRSGSLGSSYSPTGAQLFAGSTIVSANVNSIVEPPSELPTWILNVTGMSYTDSTPGPEALEVDVDTTGTNTFLVETSGPVSPGITSAAAVRRWRTLPTNASNLVPNQFSLTAATVAILTQYKYLFPSPATGNTIWFRFTEIFYGTDGFAPLVNRLKQTFRLVIA